MKDIKLTQFHEALELALEKTTPITKKEFISIFEANKRVLGEDLLCQKALPAFDNSAMDGYIVKLADAGKKVNIKESIFAGDEFKNIVVEDGICHKIMTGAIVPPSAEAVVPFEDVEVINENEVVLPKKIKKEAHIRFKGEETNIGERILKKGTLLKAGEIAILASQGVSSVKVYEKPKVAVISSGDEIVEPWDNAKEHQIYNSNSIGIYAFLKDLGIDPVYVGALPDDRDLLEKKVQELNNFDLVVSSGGVSVGEADYTAEVFLKAGLEMYLHGIACKPGKHGMFGKMGKTHVLGLPGNPLSSMSMFSTFVAPITCKLSNRNNYFLNYTFAKIKEDFSFKGKRANIIYGNLINGEFEAYNKYNYSSGMLSPLINSNAFIIAKMGVNGFKKGETVKVISNNELNIESFYEFYS